LDEQAACFVFYDFANSADGERNWGNSNRHRVNDSCAESFSSRRMPEHVHAGNGRDDVLDESR